MKRAVSAVLAAILVLAGVPGFAQGFGPNTVWGSAPAGAGSAQDAVLLDSAGRTVATVPVIGGKFAFREVVAGSYAVILKAADGKEIARSLPVEIATGAEVEAVFDRDQPAAAIPPAASAAPAAPAAAGGGIGTTGLILIGAAAVGITSAIVLASDDDERVASPVR